MSRTSQQVTFAELINRGILEIGDGYRAKLEELNGNGPIFLRAGLMTEHGFDWSAGDRFNAEMTASLNAKIGRPGDTVVTTKGNSVGRTGYIPDGAPEFVYSPHLSYWRSRDHAQLDPRFLRYWSMGDEFLRQLDAMAGSTDMAPYLSLTDQYRLRITLPSSSSQKGAAAVLGALDDKISLNNEIVESCDRLRTLQFNDWLIRNDDHVSSRPLSALADFVNGRAFTKNATGAGRMVIRIAEINSGPTSSTVYTELDVPPQHIAEPGDVLFAWSGSLTVARWCRPQAIINQHIFKVISKRVPIWLIYELIRSKLPYFRAIAAGKATTMGHIQRHHLDVSVSIPTDDSIGALDTELAPLWDCALAAQEESLKLCELRDALLPHLISGEVQVREAGRVIEAIT